MNAVALLLRDVTISHWNTGNKALLFPKSTVDAFNLYCSQNPNQCSLNFWKSIAGNLVLTTGLKT